MVQSGSVARYRPVAEGFICRELAAASRVVVGRSGELICTYAVRSAPGVADFAPHLARSSDGGWTWDQQGPIWPEEIGRASISCALSRSPAGELFVYGTSTPVAHPGESWWDGSRLAMKQNDLIVGRSDDEGRTWTRPTVIPMPIPGGAEAPGPLTVLADGRWVACYAPYNTFDRDLVVDRNQIVLVLSDDRGRTWRHTSMLRFADPESGGAEAWVVQLADGRLLGTCWEMNLATGADHPIPYALSHDGGATWTPTASSGVQGQATSLAPLRGGGVLMVYNQREDPDPGVWLAVADPTDTSFGTRSLGPAWLAERATHSAAGSGLDEWTDFAFGEPSVTLLTDGDVFVTLWCDQPSGRGIRCVRLAADSIPMTQGDR